MSSHHNDRLSSTIKRMVAEFISEEGNPQPMITVIDCTLSQDAKHATIIVSVIPESMSEQALIFLQRKRSDLRTYAKKHLKTRSLPFFDFILAGR